MEFAVEAGSATVVAFEDGSASVYFSNGAGFIGGKDFASIRDAARLMVAATLPLERAMKRVDSFPLPSRPWVVFYALTDAGILSSQQIYADLRNPAHPFNELFRFSARSTSGVSAAFSLSEPNREDAAEKPP